MIFPCEQGSARAAAEFIVLRTPYLPIDELFVLGEGLEAVALRESEASLDAVLARDRERVRSRLRALCARSDVREALFLASPSLEGHLDVWNDAPESLRGQKVELSLLRYLLRMAGRPTPFGLFAGITLGAAQPDSCEQTRLRIQSRCNYRGHTRLDCSYLVALAEKLRGDPAVKRRLKYFPNSSMYRSSGRFRYVEIRMSHPNKASYHLVAVEPTSYLERTLKLAETGVRIQNAARAICAEDPEVTSEEAEDFVGELIAHQILVSELAPLLTGPEPLEDLLAQLAGLADVPSVSQAASALANVREALATMDAGAPGANHACYDRIAKTLANVDPGPAIGRLFQVDLVKPAADVRLGRPILAELSRGVELLHRIGGCGLLDPLARFRAEFQQRYADREIPLCEALDEEMGIGFRLSSGPTAAPESLLEGLNFPSAVQTANAAFRERDAILLQWLCDAVATGSREIVLDQDKISALEKADAARGEPLPLPDSFCVVAAILASGENSLNSGDYRIFITNVSGPSGANLLGRFCHSHPELTAKVRDYLRTEEALHPEAVFAEIVHLSQSRTGNVLLRPQLRSYEIPYLGRSGAPRDHRIPMSDLRIAIVDDRVVLRSESLGREIIPRMTAAHNFNSAGNIGIYRFLGSLQEQGTTSRLSFSFGALSQAPFLPRVVWNRLVLAPARWNLSDDQISAISVEDLSERFMAVQAIRRRLSLPRWVAVMDRDRQLPIDLDNILCVEATLPLLKDRSTRTLVELFYGDEDLLASGPEGRFVHEVIVPFLNSRKSPVKAASLLRSTNTVARTFPPGSDWLYAKLYTGASDADLVLLEIVRPFVQNALSSGAADNWFFVRYADPDWHIRLRLHGDKKRLLREVLPVLLDITSTDRTGGALWRVQLDTYEREVERYGGPTGVLLAEQLFRADSDCVLDVMETMQGESLADARWRIALAGIDRLLTDFGFSLPARHDIVRGARDRFGREFHADTTLYRQIGERYRRERSGLESLLRQMSDEVSTTHCQAAFSRRSSALKPIMGELRQCEQVGGLTESLSKLAGSYIHMYANRILRSAARAQEMILYDFLCRLYESQIARGYGRSNRANWRGSRHS